MDDETFTVEAYPSGCACAACERVFAVGDTMRFLAVPHGVMNLCVPRCLDCAMQDAPLHDGHPLTRGDRLIFLADGSVEVLTEKENR